LKKRFDDTLHVTKTEGKGLAGSKKYAERFRDLGKQNFPMVVQF